MFARISLHALAIFNKSRAISRFMNQGQKQRNYQVAKKGHGIPDTIVKDVRDVMRRFFELPYEEKQQIKMTQAIGFSKGILMHMLLRVHQKMSIKKARKGNLPTSLYDGVLENEQQEAKKDNSYIEERKQ